jgi:hypothetical protein
VTSELFGMALLFIISCSDGILSIRKEPFHSNFKEKIEEGLASTNSEDFNDALRIAMDFMRET